MGCEIARQLLDLMGHSQLSAKQLLPEEEYYEGTSLLAAAAAAQRAVHTVRFSDPRMISEAVQRFRRVLNALIVPAWAALLLGTLFPVWGLVKPAGFLVLGVVSIFGILDLGRGLESQRETLELLKKTGCFEPDEIIKLRRLLQALRLEGLAKIYKVPYELITSGLTKRKNSRS